MAGEVEILFIDDEPYFARNWINKLEEAGFVVHYCEQAQDARVHMDENPNIGAIVLDIMMPPPEGVPDAITDGGIRTGLWLLREIKGYVESKPRPVLILTNRGLQPIEEELEQLELPQWLVVVRRKVETPAFFLPKFFRGFWEEVQQRVASS